MALPSRLAGQLRSSTSTIRNGLLRRGFSSQSGSSKGRSIGNAAPFLLGAASAASTLMAAKYYYDNKDKFAIIQPVHAGSRIVVRHFFLCIF